MSPKKAPKAVAKPSKAPAKSAKPAKSAAPSKKAPLVAAPQPVAASDDDDMDEMEEGATGGGGGLTPALTKPEEAPTAPMTTKNFRNHPDMENFFRFIYENDLRIEALSIIDEIISERHIKKMGKKTQPNA